MQDLNSQEQAFKQMFEAFDNKNTLEEMGRAFEKVVEFAQRTFDATEEEVKNLRSMFLEAKNELKSGNLDNFNTGKARMLAYCEEEMGKMIKSHDKMLVKLETKLAKIKEGSDGKDGIDGKDGADGKNGKDGKDGSPDNPEQVRDKLETLQGKARLNISAIAGVDELKKEIGKGQAIIGGGLGGDAWHNGSGNQFGKITVSATAPNNPAVNDLWVDIS